MHHFELIKILIPNEFFFLIGRILLRTGFFLSLETISFCLRNWSKDITRTGNTNDCRQIRVGMKNDFPSGIALHELSKQTTLNCPWFFLDQATSDPEKNALDLPLCCKRTKDFLWLRSHLLAPFYGWNSSSSLVKKSLSQTWMPIGE